LGRGGKKQRFRKDLKVRRGQSLEGKQDGQHRRKKKRQPEKEGKKTTDGNNEQEQNRKKIQEAQGWSKEGKCPVDFDVK